MQNHCWNEECQVGVCSAHSYSCGDCSLHSLRMLPHLSKICGTKCQIHLQFCVEAIDLTGGNDCPLTVAIVQVVHKKNNTSSCSVHQAELCEKPVSCAAQQVLDDGLTYIASNTSSSFSSCLPWPVYAECPCFLEAAVYHCKHLSLGLPRIWIQTLIFLQCHCSISVTKAIHKIHIVILCINELCQIVMQTISTCSTSSVLWCYKALPHSLYKKMKTKSLKHH